MIRLRHAFPARWLALALALTVPAPPLLTAMHTLFAHHVWCPVHNTLKHRELDTEWRRIAESEPRLVFASAADPEPEHHQTCQHQLWLERTHVTEVGELDRPTTVQPSLVPAPRMAPARSSIWRLLEAPKLSPPLA